MSYEDSIIYRTEDGMELIPANEYFDRLAEVNDMQLHCGFEMDFFTDEDVIKSVLLDDRAMFDKHYDEFEWQIDETLKEVAAFLDDYEMLVKPDAEQGAVFVPYLGNKETGEAVPAHEVLKEAKELFKGDVEVEVFEGYCSGNGEFPERRTHEEILQLENVTADNFESAFLEKMADNFRDAQDEFERTLELKEALMNFDEH